jgi:hypothetical protein
MAAAAKRRKRLETTLAAAVAHPIRSKCLVILAERTASPAEIARQLNRDVTNIGYHVNGLVDARLIEKVSERKVRGAVEHFYRATLLPIVTEEQEGELGEEDRRTYAETILSVHAAAASDSLEVGTFLRRTDHHLTRYTLNVDEEGWAELTAAYMQLYEHVYEVEENSGRRMRGSKEKPVRVVSFLNLFEVPWTAK